MDRSRLERLAPLSGILFVIFLVASFVVLGETPDVDDSVDDAVSFWRDNEDEAMFSALLTIWAAGAAIWFGASVRGALRSAGEAADRLAALTFAGWVVFGAGATAFAGFNFAAGDVAGDEEVAGEAIQVLSILSSDFFPMIALGLALAMLATGIGTLRHGGLPRWLGYFALVLGIVAFTPAGWFAFLASGIWVIITSLVLFMQQGAGAAAAAPPPPSPAA